MVFTCNLIFPAIVVVVLLMILPEYFVVPVALQMIPTAVALVYIGAVLSRNKVIVEETLSRKDAALFPVTASCALFGLYICHKYFGREMLNIVIGLYVCIIGSFCIGDLLGGLIDAMTNNKTKKEITNLNWNIPYLGEVKFAMTISDLLGWLVGAVVTICWKLTGDRVLHNTIACCLVVQGVGMMSLTNFKVSTVFLLGLFIYDVFWVFFTEVMVTVAVNIDAPIKLAFRTSLDPAAKKSILGLGDLVVPGAVIAMTHRLDVFLRSGEVAVGKRIETPSANPSEPNTVTYVKPSFSSPGFFTVGPYFAGQMVAYAVGLTVTVIVMFVFAAGQPALFYLVPASLITFFGMALYRGEQAKVWAYSEEDPATKAAEETKKSLIKEVSSSSQDEHDNDWSKVEKEDAFAAEDKKLK